jgi:hypothetical protein
LLSLRATGSAIAISDSADRHRLKSLENQSFTMCSH